MNRFGKSNNNKCERCDQIEITKHLLWECMEAGRIWEAYNIWVRNQAVFIRVKQLSEYKDIYEVDDNTQACKVKIKIIQELIQINRPRSWNLENINSIDRNIKAMEKYNKMLKKQIE